MIENFYAHRAGYERLRDKLQADSQLIRLGESGVETTKSGGISKVPPEGDFPIARYNEYVALLREVGGKVAVRGEGADPKSVGVVVWGSGFGGDTRHIEICWLEQEPPNQVASLDEYYKSAKTRNPVFRHIDGKWYLWADW